MKIKISPLDIPNQNVASMANSMKYIIHVYTMAIFTFGIFTMKGNFLANLQRILKK